MKAVESFVGVEVERIERMLSRGWKRKSLRRRRSARSELPSQSFSLCFLLSSLQERGTFDAFSSCIPRRKASVRVYCRQLARSRRKKGIPPPSNAQGREGRDPHRSLFFIGLFVFIAFFLKSAPASGGPQTPRPTRRQTPARASRARPTGATRRPKTW